jgi:hypothetical protein
VKIARANRWDAIIAAAMIGAGGMYAYWYHEYATLKANRDAVWGEYIKVWNGWVVTTPVAVNASCGIEMTADCYLQVQAAQASLRNAVGRPMDPDSLRSY